MMIRRFNEKGMSYFTGFVQAAKSGGAIVIPEDVLESPALTERIGDVETPSGPFVDKLAFAEAAISYFGSKGIDAPLDSDHRLWMWLTARYFQDLCKNEKGELTLPKEMDRYVSEGDAPRRFLDKNLLYFPWKMVKLHGEVVHWFLRSPLGEDAAVVRELAASPRLNVHRAFIELARDLYCDPVRGVPRRGAVSFNKLGNLRDLKRTVQLLDMTYDIFGASALDLRRMLPTDRFARWLRHAREGSGGT